MNNLIEFNVYGNDFTTGLEYLSSKYLKKIACGGKIQEQLTLYGGNLFFWRLAHSEKIKEAGKKIVNPNINYSRINPSKMITIPKYLEEQMTNTQLSEIDQKFTSDYTDFSTRDIRSFS